jgi:L-lactate dehydrogenase (cytochrome)
MKISEALQLLRIKRPTPPYGAFALARCYSIDDVARVARLRLPLAARAYLDNGGQGEYTLRRNRAALDMIELLPEQPRDVTSVDTSTTVLGHRAQLPIVLSPVGAPRFFHHEGERAVARAAGHSGVPYGVSTLATVPVEQIAAEAKAPLWFQLYAWGDRRDARRAVERAHAAGFGALLLSIDTNVRALREREKRCGLDLPSPELSVLTFLEGALHPTWAWHFVTSEAISFPNIGPPDHRSREKVNDMFDGSLSWDDIKWIRQVWDRPLLVKGVLRPEEAVRAVELGLDGVVVSNHGGRQLDHVPATIDVLPEIVDAVQGRLEVLVDSGFRRGSDIVAALALGAKAVLVGRAYLYGLAAAGEAGVRHCVDILANEIRTTMALCGTTSIKELDRHLLRWRDRSQSPYPQQTYLGGL